MLKITQFFKNVTIGDELLVYGYEDEADDVSGRELCIMFGKVEGD